MKKTILLTAMFLALVEMMPFPATARAAGPTPIQPKLMFETFETGDLKLKWRTYSDAIQGGKSTIQAQGVDGGAAGTKKALRLTGTVTTDFHYGFAGARAWFDQNGQGKPMKGYTGVRFFARGDGDVYQVQVLCTAVTDYNEFSKEFVASKEWTEIQVPFSQLAQSPYWGTPVSWNNIVKGVGFQTGGGARPFRLEVDEIGFY